MFDEDDGTEANGTIPHDGTMGDDLDDAKPIALSMNSEETIRILETPDGSIIKTVIAEANYETQESWRLSKDLSIFREGIERLESIDLTKFKNTVRVAKIQTAISTLKFLIEEIEYPIDLELKIDGSSPY